MASNKHAQIRYKVLDDCFSNFRRKFYFSDLMERCNEALRELYGEDHTGIKTRTLRSDINYIRSRASLMLKRRTMEMAFTTAIPSPTFPSSSVALGRMTLLSSRKPY